MLNRHDLRRAVRNELSRYYVIYSYFAKKNGAYLVEHDTDLVIEGFPRSANSFFEAAVRMRHQNPLKLSHHTHARSNIDRAIQLSVPCVVLLRNPIDAVISYMEESEKLSSPNVLLREYIIFYQNISQYKEKVKLITFETATKDTEHAIDHVFDWAGLIKTNHSHFSDAETILDEVTSNALSRVGIVPAYRRAKTEMERMHREQRREEICAIVKKRSIQSLRLTALELYESTRQLCI